MGAALLERLRATFSLPSVHYRVFGITPRMEPVERDDTVKNDASITIEVVVS